MQGTQEMRVQSPGWEDPCIRESSEVFYFPVHLKVIFKLYRRTSLVVLWLRIRLPMQGTWVRSLVQEDSTCRRAANPVSYNY